MKSLLDGGATVALGSDWFVTEPSILAGIHAAVTRQTIDGNNPGGLIPSERVSVFDALRGYTTGLAYAAFEEDYRGTLEVDKIFEYNFLLLLFFILFRYIYVRLES